MWKASVYALSLLFVAAEANYVSRRHAKELRSGALVAEQAVSTAVAFPRNATEVQHTKEAGKSYLPGDPLYEIEQQVKGLSNSTNSTNSTTPEGSAPVVSKINWFVFAVSLLAAIGVIAGAYAGVGKAMGAKCVAEFVGTYLLVLTVGCNVLSKNSTWAGVSIGCVLMVSIYSFGSVSGANFNPAVSLAVFISKKLGGAGIDLKTMLFYWIAQISAGVVAAFSYTLMFHDQSFELGPPIAYNAGQAGLCEFLYTGMLCFVVLNVAVAKKYSVEPNEFYGLAIGFVIIAGAYGAGPVSGGCFNPAVAIGIDAASDATGFGWCLFYVLVELPGAAFAAYFFSIVRPGDFTERPYITPVSKLSKLMSEFLGTFMLMLTVVLNIFAGSPAGAFSIAASLMCMIYALGDVSGAHFNPAVTLAIYITRSDVNLVDIGPVAQYMLAQICGALSASYTGVMIYGKNHTPVMNGGRMAHIAWGEIVFTFILCWVVLAVAFHTKTQSKTMFGLAIGSCVTVGGFAAGKLCRAALNPAVSIGLIVAGGGTHKAIIYTLFEIMGAFLAAKIYRMTHHPVNLDFYDLPKTNTRMYSQQIQPASGSFAQARQ